MSTIKVSGKDLAPQEVIDSAMKQYSWFAIIGVFSLVNTVIHLLKGDISFVGGLGITQIVDGIALAAANDPEMGKEVVAVVYAIAVIVNLFITGIFFAIWWFSKKGSAKVYVAGLVLYLLDALLVLLLTSWVDVVFHGIFLFMMFGGYQFVKRRKEAEAMLKEGDSAIANLVAAQNQQQPPTGTPPLMR